MKIRDGLLGVSQPVSDASDKKVGGLQTYVFNRISRLSRRGRRFYLSYLFIGGFEVNSV